MITSDQIAAQIAYSNQNIQPMAGAHSYGYGAQGAPSWRADSGGMGFTPWGPGLGDQMGSGFVRGMGSAASLAGTIGTVGAAAKWAGIGPSWLHSTRFAAGFGMGLAPGLAVGMGIPWAMNQMANGASQQSSINNTMMQSFGDRVSMGGRGGLGMNRGAMMQVGNIARELAGVPELMTSMGELNRILERMSDMKMLNGVRDVNDFKKKFTSTIQGLREVSKIIGSTMEEALPLLNEAKKSGIFDVKAQVGSIVNRQATSMIGMGVSQQTIGMVQQGGAQIASQLGGKRGVGAVGAVNLLQTFSMAQQMGNLSEETVADITGETGESGLAALAQMTQGRLAVTMRDTGLGKLMSAALGETQGGKFTGKTNSNLVKMMKEGKLSRDELIKIGQDKLSAKGGLASFERNKTNLSFNVANEAGFEGLINEIQELMKDSAKDEEDIIAIVASKFLGGDQRLADSLMDVAKNMGKIEREKKSQYKKAIRVKLEQAMYKDKYTVGGQWERFKHGLHTTLAAPLEQTGADISNYISRVAESAVDSLLDRPPNVTMTESSARNMRGLLFGLPGGDKLKGDLASSEEISGSVMKVQGMYIKLPESLGVKRRNSALAAASRGETLSGLSDTSRGTIESLVGGLDRAGLTSAMRSARSDGMKSQISAVIDHLKDTDKETYSALKSQGLNDIQIASAVQEKLGLSGDNASFIDFRKESDNKYKDFAVMSAAQAQETTDSMFNSDQFRFTRSVASAFGADATFDSSKLQAIMQGGGSSKDLFLELATEGKIQVGGKSISMQDFLDASDAKLEKIAKERGVSKEDLVAMQSALDSEEGQKALKDQSGNLKKLRAQEFLGQKALAMDQLKDVSNSLGESKLTGGIGVDIKGLKQGLDLIMKDKVDDGSKQAKGSIRSLAEKFRSAKNPRELEKMKKDMLDAGVPSDVINAIEEQASWMGKESSILTGKDMGIDSFLEKLGVSSDNQGDARAYLEKAGVINSDDTITSAEAKGALDLWSQDQSLSKILGSSSTGGLMAADSEKIKEDSSRLMVEANIKFVQAVTDAVGGTKLRDSADKLSKAAQGTD